MLALAAILSGEGWVLHRRQGAFDGVHRGVEYLEFLGLAAKALTPRHYFEIGTDYGDSLNLIDADAIAVDPGFDIRRDIVGSKRVLHLYRMTSDEFFACHSPSAIFGAPIDLAFLDGMHRLEFLLRDVINTERHCHRGALMLLHDCLPPLPVMTDRRHRPRDAWTGDVWRLLPALRKYRPELRVLYLDCPPTGLVALSGLDPENDTLARHYHAILDEFLQVDLAAFGVGTLMGLYPTIDTSALAAEPGDITGVLNVAPYAGPRVLDTSATRR